MSLEYKLACLDRNIIDFVHDHSLIHTTYFIPIELGD